MAIVDERGRLFGKINLIDLGVLLFAAAVIPLGYAAYMFFRTPPPRLIAVVPNSVGFTKGLDQRVQVKGEHLRPFLRAKLGTIDARAFAVQTPQNGEISFADAPPGTYDVVLFDESQEVTRLSGALTISPPPVQLVGWFVGSASASAMLAPGLKFGPAAGPVGELLDVEQTGDTNNRRGASLRVTCQLSPDNRCVVTGTLIQVGTELNLTVPGRADRATFLVNDLRLDATWLEVKVRLMGLPDSLERVRPGDIDTHVDPAVPAGSPVVGVTTGAIVRSLGELQKNQGSYSITAVRPQPGTDLSGYGVLSAAVPVDAQAAELLIPGEASPAGLAYRGVAIRPGNIIAFDTEKYRLQALIMSISQS